VRKIKRERKRKIDIKSERIKKRERMSKRDIKSEMIKEREIER
jgi:hypothetical protein